MVHGTIGLRSIAATSWADKRLDVFAVASCNNNPMHKYWATFNTVWNKSWEWPKAFREVSAPVAVANSTDKLDAVFIGIDGQIKHLAWNPGSANTELGGKFLGVTALVAVSAVRVDLFGVDQATSTIFTRFTADRRGKRLGSKSQ